MCSFRGSYANRGNGTESVSSDDGTPRGIRTPDLLLRRQLLYPAELLAHIRASRSASASMMERVMGIEPTYPAWKAGVLPLNYTRRGAQSTFSLEIIPQATTECQSFFLFFPSRTLDSFLIWKRIQKNLYKSYKYSINFLVDLALRSVKAD